MCGLVGYFGNGDPELAPSAGVIRHRGPDMQAISSGNGWKIAFNRLSIIDVSERGMQPFTFDGVSVFMNGEIYNYRELKEEHKHEYACQSGSDVEIVPFLYRKYGIACLQKLNGMFAMALMDAQSGRYFLIRDRFGKKPLFYTQTAQGIFFASELKALEPLVRLRPDKTNLAMNLACWLLVQPLTPYERVFQVNPGHYVEFDGVRAAEHLWYEPVIPSREPSYDEVRNSFMALYRESIRLRLRSDVPVGICLSGGLDSTSMAFLAREQSAENFLAFTAKIVGKETWDGTTDTENPTRFAGELGIRQIATVVDASFWNTHIVDIVRNYDEIFLNSGTLVFYALSAAAKANGVKVLLSGVGGDELFGGYPWQARARLLPSGHLEAAMRRRSSALTRRAHAAWSKLGPGRIRTRIARAFRLLAQFQVWHAQSVSSTLVPYMSDIDAAVAERIESLSGNYFGISTRAVSSDPFNQINYANVFTVIANQNYQLDMACMRNSVENRGPLLDYKLVEYLMSVPDRMKNETGPKSLMRRILSEFLPAYITTSRKSGPTMPLDRWYRSGGVGSEALRFLRANRDRVGDLVSSTLADHMRGAELYAGQSGAMRMFALLSFVIWTKLNVERSVRDPGISFADLAHA
jgi:asparagine synthase (glutamine-hydrolysing)